MQSAEYRCFPSFFLFFPLFFLFSFLARENNGIKCQTCHIWCRSTDILEQTQWLRPDLRYLSNVWPKSVIRIKVGEIVTISFSGRRLETSTRELNTFIEYVILPLDKGPGIAKSYVSVNPTQRATEISCMLFSPNSQSTTAVIEAILTITCSIRLCYHRLVINASSCKTGPASRICI